MNRREFVKLAPAFPAAAVTATLTLHEDGKEPLELDVSVLKVQPGDTLVLSVDAPVSAEMREHMKLCIEQACGKDVQVLVLSKGIKLEGVLRV